MSGVPMFLKRTYSDRAEIPKGAEQLYVKRGALFIADTMKRDFVADNPWEVGNWNLTAQMRFITEHGAAIADAFAKMAGTKVGALNPSVKMQPDPVRVLIQRRTFGTSGGGSDNSGSSGDGPPS